MTTRPALTRCALAAALALGTVAVPVTSASATSGGGWQPIVAPPNDAFCGTTVVHVSFPAINAFFRVLPQPDGALIIQTKGTSTALFTTDSGASVSYHQAGPGTTTVAPNGDAETVNSGAGVYGLTQDEVHQLGAPSELFYATGRIDFITHPDGSITPVQIPPHLVDICAALGAH